MLRQEGPRPAQRPRQILHLSLAAASCPKRGFILVLTLTPLQTSPKRHCSFYSTAGIFAPAPLCPLISSAERNPDPHHGLGLDSFPSAKPPHAHEPTSTRPSATSLDTIDRGLSPFPQRPVFPRCYPPRSTIPTSCAPPEPARRRNPTPASHLGPQARAGMAPLSNAQKGAITQQFMQLTGAPDRVASRVRHDFNSHTRTSSLFLTCSAARVGAPLP